MYDNLTQKPFWKAAERRTAPEQEPFGAGKSAKNHQEILRGDLSLRFFAALAVVFLAVLWLKPRAQNIPLALNFLQA
jgi:hypothetical protein